MVCYRLTVAVAIYGSHSEPFTTRSYGLKDKTKNIADKSAATDVANIRITPFNNDDSKSMTSYLTWFHYGKIFFLPDFAQIHHVLDIHSVCLSQLKSPAATLYQASK